MLSALYAIARPSVCPSVRLSVTRVDQSKTVEARIMQFSPYSSPISLVFAISFIQKFRRDPPRAGASNNGGLRETSYCRSSNAFARWLPVLDILSQLLQTYSPGGGTVRANRGVSCAFLFYFASYFTTLLFCKVDCPGNRRSLFPSGRLRRRRCCSSSLSEAEITGSLEAAWQRAAVAVWSVPVR